MEKEKIDTMIRDLSSIRNFKTAKTPELEGISFRYKTVQFHLIDDTFEEIEQRAQYFGDVKIFSERFSLPGYGIVNDVLSGNEYQYEVIVNIVSETTRDVYVRELEAVLSKIEEKHGVQILAEPYTSQAEDADKAEEELYNVHSIIYYTTEEGVFPRG